MKAEDLARLFHTAYEKLAPDYGYKTREESAVDWDNVPDDNRKLMIATCGVILKWASHLVDLRDYALQEAEKSYCPHCEKNVHMLAPRGMKIPSDTFPFFFLCSHCGVILESGVGEVAPPEER